MLPVPGIELATKAIWHKSPREARKASIAQGKPLLMFFAQRWDGACPSILLNDDLFAMPEFNEFAASRLILTSLQYPVGSPGKGYTEAKKAAASACQELGGRSPPACRDLTTAPRPAR